MLLILSEQGRSAQVRGIRVSAVAVAGDALRRCEICQVSLMLLEPAC